MTDAADLDVKVILESEKTAAAPAPRDPGEQYRAAVERYREASKWAVSAFGGIGALLVAALPLARLGAGSATNTAETIWGTVLALGGVTLAIAAILSVLAPRSVFTFELRSKKHNGLKRLLSGTWAMEHMLKTHGAMLLPTGINDVAALSMAINNLDKLILATEKASGADSTAVKGLHARQAKLVETQQQLLWIARLEKMRAAFHVSSVLLLVAGLAVGAGLGLLFDALYEDDKTNAEVTKLKAEGAKLEAEVGKTEAETDKLAAEAEELRANTTAPEDEAEEPSAAGSTPAVDIFLTEDGADLLPGCQAEAEAGLAGLLIGGDGTSGWEVVVLPTDECSGGRLTLTPEMGTIR